MIIDAYLIQPTQTQPSHFNNVELFSFSLGGWDQREGRQKKKKEKENLSLVSPRQLKNKT